MRLIHQAMLWFRALFVRSRVESDMAKELRLHLELETEHNIKNGMSPADARRAAMIAFGGVERTKEAVRDERLTRWLEELASDFKRALRGFRRQPAFTVGVITLIALGIGPNAAIFSVVNHLLIAPLPFHDGNRMVSFVVTSGGKQILSQRTVADVERWRARARAVESITLLDRRRFAIGDSMRGPTEQVSADVIGPDAAAFVGMRPLLGRDFVATDTLASAPAVVLLSYAYWKKEFAGSADAIGKTITLNQTAYTVVGVMPDGFAIPFWSTSPIFPILKGLSPDSAILAIAKLRRGSTVDDANRELAAIFPNLDASKSEDAPVVERAVDQVPPQAKRTILLLFGAVGLVLIIACANVANLMVSRAWTRQREFTIRAAMGARRMRLVRHVIVESLTLSLFGGAAGIAVALATLRLMSKTSQLAREVNGARLEPAVLLWVVGLSVAAGTLFGLAPAIFVSSDRAADALKAGNRSVAGNRSSKRLRSALVICEVALSAVLLIASGLMVRTLGEMQRADVGFQSTGLYGVQFGMRGKTFADSVARHAAVESLLAQVRAVPGVRQASLSLVLPPDFVLGIGQLEIEGATVAASDSLSISNLTIARPDIFSLMGIRLLQGRAFARYDALTDRSDQGEVVVNEGFAHRFFPGGGAIGARIRRGGTGQWATVVGIANDIIVPGAGQRKNAVQFYMADGASPHGSTLVFRTDLPRAAAIAAVSDAIRTSNPNIKIGRSMASDDALAGSRQTQAYTLRLIGAFAVLSLVLAAFGLYSTIAYSVSQRTRELGIRVALGAQSHDVMTLVMGQGVKLTLAGIALGAFGGILAGGTMRALLYRVTPADPLTVAAVAALLAVLAVVASWIPARRAVRVDPVEALRAE